MRHWTIQKDIICHIICYIYLLINKKKVNFYGYVSKKKDETRKEK